MLKTFFRSLARDDQGQDLVEYAVMAGLISILSVVLSNAARAL